MDAEGELLAERLRLAIDQARVLRSEAVWGYESARAAMLAAEERTRELNTVEAALISALCGAQDRIARSDERVTGS